MGIRRMKMALPAWAPDGGHYDMTVEAGDHIAGAITVTVCRVEVAQEHDGATNFELKFVLWHP